MDDELDESLTIEAAQTQVNVSQFIPLPSSDAVLMLLLAVASARGSSFSKTNIVGLFSHNLSTRSRESDRPVATSTHARHCAHD